MRISLLTVLALFLFFAVSSRAAAPPRPYSGCGVLEIPQTTATEPAPIAIYAEPGVQRVAEREIQALPSLRGNQEPPLIAVGAVKAGWVRLFFDNAGREGWVDKPRPWEYLPWREFLPGRQVRILPGMKKGLYLLKGEPRENGPERGVLSRGQLVRVVQVEEDWARLQVPSGWFRWRDRDGRLTVSP